MLSFLCYLDLDAALLTVFLIFGFISKDLGHYGSMGIEDPKIRLFVFLLINIIVIFSFRYWVLNNESLVWLLNGLPS